MIFLILAIWLGVEAYRRRLWRLIPVSILFILYEAADSGILRVTKLISMEGMLKRLILWILLIFIFLAWRKKQVKLSVLIVSVLQTVSSIVWKIVFSSYRKYLLQLEDVGPSDLAGLFAASTAFNLVTGVWVLVMLVLLLVQVRKLPLPEKIEPGC